jgi:hypothetical protein
MCNNHFSSPTIPPDESAHQAKDQSILHVNMQLIMAAGKVMKKFWTLFRRLTLPLF